MTKTEMKHLAQKLLILHGQIAFNRLEDEALTQEEKNQLYFVMHKEFARMEKLFGFKPNSWGRGV